VHDRFQLAHLPDVIVVQDRDHLPPASAYPVKDEPSFALFMGGDHPNIWTSGSALWLDLCERLVGHDHDLVLTGWQGLLRC
jgi:hypothetical protein